MVHNGIEYGLMAAYAEGLNILHKADIGLGETGARRGDDATRAPRVVPVLARPRRDLRGVASRQRHRSPGCSTSPPQAFVEDPELAEFSGRVSDSGEGRWTIQAAIDEGVPAHVLTTALYERFASRGEAAFADKITSAMRKQFGGHAEKKD